MGTVGIVANPNSGKDIRRLVTHATVFDNTEKVNILRRIIAGVIGMGEHKIYLMPDRYRLGKRTLDSMDASYKDHVEILKMPVYDQQDDSTRFARLMVKEKQADVLIVMGGDGTSRAVAKVVGDVPLIPVSTGTNNVYPTMIEGTSVAFAAAAIAEGIFTREEVAKHGKRIEISVKNAAGEVKNDIALIDAVFSTCTFVGVRALLSNEEIGSVLVTQCHPASIGFSALAGSVDVVSPQEDGGLFLEIDWEKDDYIAAISAGTLTKFGVTSQRRVANHEKLSLTAAHDGIVAVDGERELPFREGDEITLVITENGPRKVDVRDLVERASKRGFFHRNRP